MARGCAGWAVWTHTVIPRAWLEARLLQVTTGTQGDSRKLARRGVVITQGAAPQRSVQHRLHHQGTCWRQCHRENPMEVYAQARRPRLKAFPP